MLPSLYIPPYKLFGLLPIQPFGILVASAVVLGYYLGRRRARLTGLDPQICADGMVWIVASGFVIAHLVEVFFYSPERILDNPLVILMVWNGISSYGGYLGAILGAFYFFKKHKVSVMKYCDAILFGFVPAWILGRTGCTIVFDHPGLPTDFILGMMDHRDQIVRHNLGMYEMLLAIVLTIVIYSIKNIRPFDGFHPAIVLILYTPVRFILDYYRTADKTYLGLTPGQYFSVLMFGFAIYLIIRGLKKRKLENST